jgi:hypothetical protein
VFTDQRRERVGIAPDHRVLGERPRRRRRGADDRLDPIDERRPAILAVLAGDDELCVGELEGSVEGRAAGAEARMTGGNAGDRLGIAGAPGAQQTLGLLPVLGEVRSVGKRSGHTNLLSRAWRPPGSG